MKILIIIFFIFFYSNAFAIEITKDNPKTLINTKGANYTIYGLKLGMTHEQAWDKLKNISFLKGKEDEFNPSRIYVYKNDKTVLYLIWESSEKTMSSITVFQDFKENLSENFKKLLTLESIDDDSLFKQEFLGYANSSKVTLELKSIGIDYLSTSFFYDWGDVSKHEDDGKVYTSFMIGSFNYID